MRRLGVTLALSALLGTLGGVVAAAPAFARGPQWQLLDAQSFTTDSCGFQVGVTVPVNASYTKLLKVVDGSTILLTTGRLDVSYTNLQTGRTITENESGPGKTTVFPDGSVTLRPAATTGSSSRQPTRSGSACLL